MNTEPRFWQHKSLFEMSREEWESVCDGCAKCCLVQLQNEENDELVFTDVACKLLDDQSCRCKDYQNRSIKVPRCMILNQRNVAKVVSFAPPSCAYRLLLEGKELPDWHHLNTGSTQAMHEQGFSVRRKVRSEQDVSDADLQNYIVEWPLRAG